MATLTCKFNSIFIIKLKIYFSYKVANIFISYFSFIYSSNLTILFEKRKKWYSEILQLISLLVGFPNLFYNTLVFLFLFFSEKRLRLLHLLNTLILFLRKVSCLIYCSQNRSFFTISSSVHKNIMQPYVVFT